MAVEVERARRLFTIEEYERMAETGILTWEDRVELIEGEIVEMSPIGDAHAASAANFNHLLVNAVGGCARVWHGPIRIPPRSKPQPDLALLRPRSYVRVGAMTEDALLAIEIADTSLRYDRTVKLRLYARAGIPEYWIIDATAETLEMYREPSGNGYTTRRQAGRGETIAPLAFLDASITVDAIFA